MKKTKAANIKVRAACITGPVHLGRGQLCQDRCRWSTRGANFVAVVSDGAGSTKYGRIGAKIVCDTLVDLLENAPFKDIRAAIVKAIGVARDKLAFHRLNSANNKKGGINAVIETTLNLPSIPGGKKLIYTHIEMPLTPIAEFGEKGKSNPVYAELHKLCEKHKGLWNPEAEAYLLANADKL